LITIVFVLLTSTYLLTMIAVVWFSTWVADVLLHGCYFRCRCLGTSQWDLNRYQRLLPWWLTCIYQLLQQQRNTITVRQFYINVSSLHPPSLI